MAINIRRNKPFGPGGGTRRLHHYLLWGRNRIDEGVKDRFSPGMVSAVIGPIKIVANDNYAEVPMAA